MFKVIPGVKIVVFVDISEETTSGLVVVTKESLFIRFDEFIKCFVLIGALTLAGFEVITFVNISIEVRSDFVAVMTEFILIFLDEDTKDFVYLDDFIKAISALVEDKEVVAVNLVEPSE